MSTRKQQVRQAIKDIRALYALGREIPPKAPHREAYGRRVVEAEAERRGTNPDKIRKARQLADPAEGYAHEELRDLCRLIAKVQPGQDDTKAVFRPSHLIRLLSVRPKRRRAALQRQAIEKGWSTAELDGEIARRFGTRRQGGRRRRIPGGLAEVYTQLESMCESWRRWHAELSRQPGEGGERHVLLSDLPRRLRGRVVEVSEAVWGLHQAVVVELREVEPGRALRDVFQEPPAAAGAAAGGGRREGRRHN